MASERRNDIGRRSLLRWAGAVAATPLLGGIATPAFAQAPAPSSPAAPGTIGRRRLGKLEVSSVGLGVQNMSRKYETTVPYCPEMINIIRTAYDKLIRQWAERKSATPAQIALAWLMAQKPWIVPIPGTTQMAHMLENIGATDVRFTPSELAELNAAVSAIQIRGARLPDQVLAFSGVEAPAKK